MTALDPAISFGDIRYIQSAYTQSIHTILTAPTTPSGTLLWGATCTEPTGSSQLQDSLSWAAYTLSVCVSSPGCRECDTGLQVYHHS